MLRAALFVLFAALPAFAQTPGLEAVRLLAGSAQGETRLAGLRIALAPGWKTYWRHAGEAGIAPVFDWTGSRNVASLTVLWPGPERFDEAGLESFGYHDGVTLPLEITPGDADQPITLALSLSFGLCRELCVPALVETRLEIAPEAREAEAEIAAAIASLPRPAEAAGLEAATCALRGAGPEREFEAALRFDHAPARLATAIEGPQGVFVAAADIALSGDEAHLTAPLFVEPPERWIARDAMRITLITEAGAFELRGCEG